MFHPFHRLSAFSFSNILVLCIVTTWSNHFVSDLSLNFPDMSIRSCCSSCKKTRILLQHVAYPLSWYKQFWGRPEERETLKCPLHQLALQTIFKYPYQAILKNKCVWSDEDCKTLRAALCRTAQLPCNPLSFRSWSICPEFHQMWCSKDTTVCKPCREVCLGRKMALHTLILHKHMQSVLAGSRAMREHAGRRWSSQTELFKKLFCLLKCWYSHKTVVW